MKAEQVVEKILSQANQEAEAIQAEAQSKIQARRAALQEESKTFDQETEALAKAAAEDRLARMMAAARMDLRKQVLAAKAALLQEVFDKARQRVNTLPNDGYGDLMTRLLTKAAQTGDEEVITGRNETRLTHDFLKQVNKKLGLGFKGNLRLSGEKADIDGGFLLRRGKVQINCSTEVLIDQVRQNMETELAGELFGE